MKKNNQPTTHRKQVAQSAVPERMEINNPYQILFDRLSAIECKLANIDSIISSVPAPPSDLMSIKEAALFLGFSIHTIHDKTYRKELPFSKKGRRLYFSRTELMQWIKSGNK